MKYIVELKYTNPGHEHVSLRRRVDTVTRLVEASNEQEALNRAANQQRALGFKIQEAKVVTPATEPVQLSEGFDTDPKDIAAYLVDRHGKGKVTMDHIEAYERRRDSHRPIEKHEVMKHVKKMSEEVEQIDEDHAAAYDKHMTAHYNAAERGDWDTAETHAQRAEKAAARHFKATGKKIYDPGYTGGSKHVTQVKEEVEQIDELKKSTLASYVNKAANQVRAKSGIAASFETQGERKRDPERKASYMSLAKDYRKGAKKRLTGIEKAAAKLAKEEVGADKRDAGYKMSPAVRAAQKKSDELSKVVKRPQAGTLAAVHKSMERTMERNMKKEAADPGSMKVVNKKVKAADKMIGAAKKAAVVNFEPELKITRPMI